MPQRAGVKFTKVASLPLSSPSLRGEGQVEYANGGLWLRDNGSWKQVGAQYRDMTSGTQQPKLFTGQATGDSNGKVTLAVPAGYFTTITDVQVTAWQATAAVATAGWAQMVSASLTEIVAQVWAAGPILLLSGNPTKTLGGITCGFLVVGT